MPNFIVAVNYIVDELIDLKVSNEGSNLPQSTNHYFVFQHIVFLFTTSCPLFNDLIPLCIFIFDIKLFADLSVPTSCIIPNSFHNERLVVRIMLN